MKATMMAAGIGLVLALSACGQQAPAALSASGSGARVSAQHTAFCTYTQGYYKNHPAQFAAALQRYSSYGVGWTLNTPFYGSPYTWGNILGVPPRGDAYLILAHQYVTAVANGLWREWPETNPGAKLWEDTEIAAVQTAYRRARFFFEQTDPFKEGAKTPTRDELIAWATVLDDFNNGKYAADGYAHC